MPRASLFTAVALTLSLFGGATVASAHDISQAQQELRARGYTKIQFLVDEAPFQVNACQGRTRYHLHVDFYGRITERTTVGECHWWTGGFRR